MRVSIAGQVQALHVFGIADAQDHVEELLSVELVVGQIDVQEFGVALDQSSEFGGDHVVLAAVALLEGVETVLAQV